MSPQLLSLSDLSSRTDPCLSGKSSTTGSCGPSAFPPHVDISRTPPSCSGNALLPSHRPFLFFAYIFWLVSVPLRVYACVWVCACLCVCVCARACRVRGSVWNTHCTITRRRILRLIFYVADIQWQLNSQPPPSHRWNLGHLFKKGKIPRTGVTTFGGS